jgi:hypothetical protein
MNSESKNMISQEDEDFLNQMSSHFQKYREKTVIDDIVNRKIATSSFSSLSLRTNGRVKLIKKSIIYFSILLLIPSFYFIFDFFNNWTNDDVSKKLTVEHNDNFFNKNYNLSNGDLSSELNHSESKQDNKIPNRQDDKQIKKSSGGNKRQIVNSTDTIDLEIEIPAKRINSIINIPSHISVAELSQQIISLLKRFGYTMDLSSISNNSMNIKTKDVEAISKEGQTVEYNLNFRIDKKNPDVLRIHLEYFDKIGTNNNSYSMNTMEDMFYNKIADGLRNILSKN